jgi:hypothetical protein
MKKIHSEIMYTKEDGVSIHSDTCPKGCDFNNINKEYRKYAHALLDEWLDKSGGTGIFYIKEDGFKDYGNEDSDSRCEIS